MARRGTWIVCYALSDVTAPESKDTADVMERHAQLEDELVMARYACIVGSEARHEVLLFYTEPLRRLGHSLASASVNDGLRPEYWPWASTSRCARRAFRMTADADGS